MSSPIYNPPVPYNGLIQGGFLPGRMVRVQGRVNPSANSLAINLKTGPNPYDDIALHVNPRFNESVIVRNSCLQSSWGSEERHGPPLPIYRDQNFEILIMAEASAFKIAVNGQHFSEFNHRLQPLDRISYLSVDGDLTISLIQFDGTATQTSSYAASAPPMGYGVPPGAGATPYPPASALPSPGFVMPMPGGPSPPMMGSSPYPAVPSGGNPYPAAPSGGNPYPAAAGGGYPPQAQPYGGYPSQPPTGGGYYPQQPGAPGGYPPQGQPGGYYNPWGHAGPPPPHGSSGGGGLLSDASKLLAGGLAGVGLAKVANKIPGLGGGGHHGGHPSYGGHHGGHHGGGGGGPLGGMGGILGTAGALGVGGLVANKAMKKNKKSNMMKYGLPVGGALVGGYALKKGMKGFGHGGSSSSSSSSEEE